MPVQVIQSGDSLLHIHDLSSPVVKVDVTKDRAILREPEVSEYTGFDILRRGSIRPERGRKPVGIAVPVSDQPIVSAVGLSAFSSVIRNRRYSVDNNELAIRANAADAGTYTSSTGVIAAVDSGYDFTEGDICAIYTPVSLRGVFPVLARDTGASTLTLRSGIAPDASVTFDVFHNTPLSERLSVPSTGDTDWLVKTPILYEKEGPWTIEEAAGFVISNGDERVTSEKSVNSPTRATRYQLNDSLDTDGDLTPDDHHKIQIISEVVGNLRGVLLTNGRKFWLLQDNTLKLMIDLGDDALLKQTWRATRIARNRILLVNSKYAPRVLHLDATELSVGEVSGDETLAGCVIPLKPRDVENRNPDLNLSASWLAFSQNTDGGLELDRHYKIKIRGVSLEDNLESEFVQVFSAASRNIPTDQHATLKENILINAGHSQISVYMAVQDDGGFSPPIHSRITHIEVWRSTASTANDTDAPDVYYLESRMEIADLVGNEVSAGGSQHPLFDDNPVPAGVPVQIADSIIPNFPVVTAADLSSGGTPPICQDVVSLKGVTFCFGKADAPIVKPKMDGIDYFLDSYKHSVISSKSRINKSNAFTDYTFVAGDTFRVLHGGRDANGKTIPIGDFAISSKISNSIIELTTEISLVTTTGSSVIGHIVRSFEIDWPRILSDEEVWFSRTDLFAPESFPVRVKTVSRSGDIFRRAVKVSNFVVMVMDRGVHLIRLDNTQRHGVGIDTISDSGEGTPWPDSVVVVGTAVLWASQQGLRVLIASPDPDIEGRRARITPLGDDRFRSWFSEAFNNGETIDAGVDEINGCVRFRRAIVTSLGTHYRVLQYNFRNDSFVFLDDDSGFIYASCVDVTGEDDSQRLYSVSGTGNVFEVNHEEDTHPYDNLTLQDTLGSKYIVSSTSIERDTAAVFSPSMAGDIIRFRIGSDEYIRTISTATDRRLTFDSVPASLKNVVFVIAAVRTKIRFSSLRGTLLGSVKTIEKVQIKARKGDRHQSSEKLNLKTFNEFGASEQDTGTIDIFDPGDSGKTTKNEVSSIGGQAAALEIQIETIDARTDYELEQVEVSVREEADILVDSTK